MKKTKQLSATVIALLLAMTTVFSTVLPVKAAGHMENDGMVYIGGWEGEGEDYQEYHVTYTKGEAYEGDPVEGLSYDKDTNTLSMSGFDHPTIQMEIRNMGDDFKVKLTGKNSVSQIYIMAFRADCCVEFTGTGKIYANESKEDSGDAVMLSQGHEGNAILKVSDSATLYAYGKDNSVPLRVDQTKNRNCIIGTSTPAIQFENYSHPAYYTTLDNFTEETASYKVCTKAGDTNKYAISKYESGEYRSFTIYKLLQAPDENCWFTVMYDNGIDEAIINDYTETDETIEAYDWNSISGQYYETAAGKMAVVQSLAPEYEEPVHDETTGELISGGWISYYYFSEIQPYVTYKNSLGEDVTIYKTKTGEKTKYTEEQLDAALKAGGYKASMVVEDDVYNLSVTGETWTLTPHTHSFASTWSSDATSHWKECTAKDGAKDSVKAHTFEEIIDKAATTTAEGSKHEQCTVCGYKKAAVVIEKLKDTSSSQTTTPGQQTTPEAPKQESAGTELKDTTSNATVTVTNTGTTTDGKVTDAEVSYAKPTEAAAEVTIPDTVTVGGVEYAVTSIEKDAFKGDATVTKVTVGENVKTIDSGAFSGCKNLKTVKIGSNVETIGSNAFAGNAKLTTVDMGKNVTTVGDKAFQKCTSLKKVTIPATVTKVGKDAFSGCTKMTSATIGKNVKDIGANAFSGNKKLKTVTIKTSKVPKIGKNAFKGLPKDATIKVPKKLYKDFKKKLTSKTGFKKTMRLKKV